MGLTALVSAVVLGVGIAQSSEPDPAAKPPDAQIDFSLGNVAGFSHLGYHRNGAPEATGTSGVGAYARFGIEMFGRYAVEFEADWITLIFLENGWRVAPTLRWTPLRWLSVAAGPVWGGYNTPTDLSAGEDGQYFGGTMRVDFHPSANAVRRGWTFSLAGELGRTQSLSGTVVAPTEAQLDEAYGLYTTIGYTF